MLGALAKAHMMRHNTYTTHQVDNDIDDCLSSGRTLYMLYQFDPVGLSVV